MIRVAGLPSVALSPVQSRLRVCVLVTVYLPIYVGMVACLGLAASDLHVALMDEPASSRDGMAGCDPLDESACVLPFPSSFHLQPSATSHTGWQVAFGGETLPKVGPMCSCAANVAVACCWAGVDTPLDV